MPWVSASQGQQQQQQQQQQPLAQRSPKRRPTTVMPNKAVRSLAQPHEVSASTSKPPLLLPKPQFTGGKPANGTSRSREPPSSPSLQAGNAVQNGGGSPSKAPRAAQASAQLRDAERQIREQRQVTAAANRKLADSEKACSSLQMQLDQLQSEQCGTPSEFSLTDDQRGDILRAEAKVKQLQDTVFSLSNRLCLVTDINEEMDDGRSDELTAANKKIELLLQQVDGEFHKRRDTEKQLDALQRELLVRAQPARRADTPQHSLADTDSRQLPNGKVGDGTVSALQEKCTMAERKLAEAEHQVAKISTQFAELEQQAQQLRADRDAVQRKIAQTEAIFEDLSFENDEKAEECRRAQVNTRAAQMEQLSLLKELDSLRSAREQEQGRAQRERAAAETDRAELSRVLADLDTSRVKARHLQSQVNEMEELPQLLEEQKTIATSYQRAVEDTSERCQQLQSENRALQAELTARQHRIIQLTTESGARSGMRAASAAAAAGATADHPLPRQIEKHPFVHSQQSDLVKVELWRLQRENVELRHRIFQQLAGLEPADEHDHQEEEEDQPNAAATGAAAGAAAGTERVKDGQAEEDTNDAGSSLPGTPDLAAAAASPPTLPKRPGVDFKEQFLSDARSRRPLMLEPAPALESEIGRIRRAGMDEDDSLSLSSVNHDIQDMYMVDLHMGSRKEQDRNEEEEHEKRETNEAAQMVEQLLDNMAKVRFWGSADVEEHVKKLCLSHQRLEKLVESYRARLQSSESDLQKNRRALVRSVSGKRTAANRPHVVIRDKARDGKDGGESKYAEDRASAGQSSSISLADYELTIKTLSEKIEDLRNAGEGVQAAKASVENALLMHQRREQEIQRMLQEEINNLRRLNIKLATDKVDSTQATEMVEMIQQAQKYELALQQQDDLRSLVQDLQLALLQKEQTISALEWTMTNAQADITVLLTERDWQLRQLHHLRLVAPGPGPASGTGGGTTGARLSTPPVTSTSSSVASASISDYRKTLAAFRVPMSEEGRSMPDHTKTLGREDMRSKSTSSNSSFPEDKRSLSESSLDTMVFKDGVALSSTLRRHHRTDSFDDDLGTGNIAPAKWSSTGGLPSEVSTRPHDFAASPANLFSPNVLKSSGRASREQSSSGSVALESAALASSLASDAGAGIAGQCEGSTALSSRPRPHSVPVERYGSAEERRVTAGAATLKPPGRRGDVIAERAKDVTRRLEELMATDGDVDTTAGLSVDQTHEMVRRTVEAAHGTAWQVIVQASELSEASKFSNADLCQPIYRASPPQAYSPPSAKKLRGSGPYRPGHRRNCSEGNARRILPLLSSLADGGESKDNTWKRITRGDTPTSASRPGTLSPSGAASAFEKWPLKARLEAAVPRDTLEEVGGDSTWGTISTQSSAGLSLLTTSSCSPSTTATEDNDSTTESFSNFQPAAFRPYANRQRSVSPSADFGSSDALQAAAAPCPKIVPVKVLDAAVATGGGGGGAKESGERGSKRSQLPADSDHVFRPVSVAGDNSDTQSITSTGTVVFQEAPYDTKRIIVAAVAVAVASSGSGREAAGGERQMRRRSTSDVNAIVLRPTAERAPQSKTPPSSFTHSIAHHHPPPPPPPTSSAQGGDKSGDKARSSKTPDSSSGMAIVPAIAAAVADTLPASSSNGGGTVAKVATSSSSSVASGGGGGSSSSINVSSSGKARSSSWLGSRFAGRRSAHDTDSLSRASASSTLDKNATLPTPGGKTSSASLSSVHPPLRKDGSLKLRRESKSSSSSNNNNSSSSGSIRHAIASLDEAPTTQSQATTTTTSTGYSPSIPLPHSNAGGAPYTPKPASPQASPEWPGNLTQRSSSQVLRPMSIRQSMVEMEPLPKSVTKEKGKRSKALQVDASRKGTMC